MSINIETWYVKMEISTTGYVATANSGGKKKAEEMEDPEERCLPQYFDGRKKGVPPRDLESHCVEILNNPGLYCCLNHWFLNGPTSTFQDVITQDEIHYGDGGYFVKEDNGQKTPVQVAITYPGQHRWKLESLLGQIANQDWKDMYNDPIDFYLVVTSAKRTQKDSGTGLPSVTDNQDSRGTYTFSGIVKNKAGQTLEGQFNNLHQENGTGRAIFDSESCKLISGKGYVYEGEWERGRFHGEGSYLQPSGNKYTGAFKNGKYDGKGTFFFSRGGNYTGDFKNNNFNGEGTYTYSHGGMYKGQWLDDKRHGEGINTYSDGDVYKGQWLHDKRHGRGTYKGTEGDVYTGEWLNGKRHGQGSYTFSNGAGYIGDFKNNDFNGEGTMTYADGGVYKGQWLDDKRHGEGTMTYENGDVHEGEWRFGRFHSGAIYTH